MISYNFQITNLSVQSELNSFANVITTIYGKYYGTTEDGKTNYIDLTINLNAPENNFVDLENVSEENVKNWIQNVLIDLDERFKSQINAKLQNTTSSIICTTPPWVK